MAADSFGERMRDRMPAHRVWHGGATAPTLSRPADDAMWEEMRLRMRAYQAERAALRPALTPRRIFRMLRELVQSLAAGFRS
ncbi:MAG: hypothetical protein U0531_09845 [Dehalococcoidia bacterium]